MMVSFALMIASVIFAFHGAFLEAFTVLAFIPLTRMLFIGSFTARLRNLLPLFGAIIFVYLWARTSEPALASRVFLLVPALSLALKPRRHPLKYITMVVSFSLMILDLTGMVDMNTFTRILLIAWINVLFLPPMIVHTVQTLLRKIRTFYT